MFNWVSLFFFDEIQKIIVKTCVTMVSVLFYLLVPKNKFILTRDPWEKSRGEVSFFRDWCYEKFVEHMDYVTSAKQRP